MSNFHMRTVVQLGDLLDHLLALFIGNFQVFLRIFGIIAVFSFFLKLVHGLRIIGHIEFVDDDILNLRKTAASEVEQLLL